MAPRRGAAAWLAVWCFMGCSPAAVDRSWQSNLESGPVSPTTTLWVQLPTLIADQPLEDHVLLTAGDSPETLLDGVEGAAASARAELVSVAVTSQDNQLEITPRRALRTESRYTLVVTSHFQVMVDGVAETLAKPMVIGFVTTDGTGAAPVLSLVDPADGSLGIPANLTSLRVRWSQSVSSPSLVLADADSSWRQPIDGLPDPDCAECLVVPLPSTLEVGRRFEVRAGDGVAANGQAAFGDPPSFSTGPARTDPLVVEGLTFQASDGCVVARFATAVPAQANLCVGSACVHGGVERNHELGLPLATSISGPLAVELRAWDETTRPAADQTVTLASPSATPLRISEVLARPLGSRLLRQFVEVVNVGTMAVSLGGLTLADERGSSSLPDGVLAPGQVAVLVPHGFALAAGADPDPDPSSLIVELAAAHIGDNGLKVDGETVVLAASDGVVSRFSTWPATVAGQSVSRLRAAGCDVADNAAPTTGSTSTPGIVP